MFGAYCTWLRHLPSRLTLDHSVLRGDFAALSALDRREQCRYRPGLVKLRSEVGPYLILIPVPSANRIVIKYYISLSQKFDFDLEFCVSN